MVLKYAHTPFLSNSKMSNSYIYVDLSKWVNNFPVGRETPNKQTKTFYWFCKECSNWIFSHTVFMVVSTVSQPYCSLIKNLGQYCSVRDTCRHFHHLSVAMRWPFRSNGMELDCSDRDFRIPGPNIFLALDLA